MDALGNKRDAGPQDANPRGLEAVGGTSCKPVPFPVGATFGDLAITAWVLWENKGRGMGLNPLVRCVCGWEGLLDRRNLRFAKRCSKCNSRTGKFSYAQRLRYAEVMPDKAHRQRLISRIRGAINRCINPKCDVYNNYGGRGITVCREWREDRAAFLVYVQTLLGWDNPKLDFDRIDNDRGYEPGNVRFVSRSANCLNKRKIPTLQSRVDRLEKENADLRRALSGA